MGLSLLELGVTCSWGEALLLEQSLTNDPTSHYGAAVAGWQWPASTTDVALTLLAQGVLTVLMPEGKSVDFPLPWTLTPTEPIPAEVVQEMTDRLKVFSAFHD